jgi:hypothetical protein
MDHTAMIDIAAEFAMLLSAGDDFRFDLKPRRLITRYFNQTPESPRTVRGVETAAQPVVAIDVLVRDERLEPFVYALLFTEQRARPRAAIAPGQRCEAEFHAAPYLSAVSRTAAGARFGGVENQCCATGSRGDECCVQSGVAGTDHSDIDRRRHRFRISRRPRFFATPVRPRLKILGK